MLYPATCDAQDDGSVPYSRHVFQHATTRPDVVPAPSATAPPSPEITGENGSPYRPDSPVIGGLEGALPAMLAAGTDPTPPLSSAGGEPPAMLAAGTDPTPPLSGGCGCTPAMLAVRTDPTPPLSGAGWAPSGAAGVPILTHMRGVRGRCRRASLREKHRWRLRSRAPTAAPRSIMPRCCARYSRSPAIAGCDQYASSSRAGSLSRDTIW